MSDCPATANDNCHMFHCSDNQYNAEQTHSCRCHSAGYLDTPLCHASTVISCASIIPVQSVTHNLYVKL